MDTQTTLRNIFREVFDDDALAVTVDTGPKDIDGWDSVAQVKLILSIESEFGFRFTTDEASSLKKVGDFMTAIDKHLGEKA